MDRKTREFLARTAGWKFNEADNGWFSPKGEWFINPPNFDEGEIHRLLERVADKKEYNVSWLYNGKTHFITLDPYDVGEREVIKTQAPTFIEAASQALRKAGG